MLPIARLDLLPSALVSSVSTLANAVATTGTGFEAPARESEPAFDLLLDEDAAVRAAALRALMNRRDASLFVVLCAGEAVDQELRARAGLSAAPLTWRGWRGTVPGLILALPPGERLAWAVEFADKLIEAQRYPAALLATLDAGLLAAR
jgi:hypothetical protein